MARRKKTYKKQYRTRRSSRRIHMRGGSILSDLTSNFQTLKSNFTNNITTQVTSKLSAIKEQAIQRFNKTKDAITRKVNCFKT